MQKLCKILKHCFNHKYLPSSLLTFIGIVAIPSNTEVAIEQLGDRIESFEELPNENKLAIDKIDRKIEDQNEIHEDMKQTLGNKIEGLVERIEPLEELPENVKALGQRVEMAEMKCPIQSEKYKRIHGVCYFFDTYPTRTFDEAQANCKKIFGPTGKIYEPITEAQARIFYDNYGSGKLLDNAAWVGITDRETEGVYKYASSGIVVSETALFWYSDQPDNFGNQDCVANGVATIKTSFADVRCSNKYQSICEAEIYI